MKHHQLHSITAGVLVLSAGLVTSVAARQLDGQPPTSDPKPHETYQPTREGDKPTDTGGKMYHDKNARPVTLVPSKWLDDNSVRGPNDEKLGEVKDLIVARVPGKVAFALLGHGGVMTIGETVNAVPFRAFNWNPDKKYLTLSTTPEQLKAAPTLDSGEWMTLGDPTRTESICSYYNVNQKHEMDGAGEPTARKDGNGSKLGPDEHRVLRVSDLRGKALMSSDGREVGKVEDLVLDTASGRIAFVAVTFGGVVGIGEDRVAVPWTGFDINKDGHLYVTTIDKDMIRSAPRLTQKDWGELREPGFGAKVYQHFGSHAAWLEQDASTSKDWSKANTDYDNLYTSGTARDVNGQITSVTEESPTSGMDQVVVLTVNNNTNDAVTVHVCPKSYLDQNDVQLRKGESVQIKGREATVNGKPVVIATEVTPTGGKALALRHSDGTCTWQHR